MQFSKITLTAAATAALLSTGANAEAQYDTTPATVINHNGTPETIWWVPTTTNSWWTPEWWNDYTSQGGKVASAPTSTLTDTSLYLTTKDGSTFWTSTTFTSTSTPLPGTTTTGSVITTKLGGTSTTITPTLDIFTTTNKKGDLTTTTSTVRIENGAASNMNIMGGALGSVVITGLVGLGASLLCL